MEDKMYRLGINLASQRLMVVLVECSPDGSIDRFRSSELDELGWLVKIIYLDERSRYLDNGDCFHLDVGTYIERRVEQSCNIFMLEQHPCRYDVAMWLLPMYQAAIDHSGTVTPEMIKARMSEYEKVGNPKT